VWAGPNLFLISRRALITSVGRIDEDFAETLSLAIALTAGAPLQPVAKNAFERNRAAA